MLRRNIHFLQRLIVCRGYCSPLEIKSCENCVASMMIQDYSGTTNVARFFNSPESNIFFAARDKSAIINGTEFDV